MYKYMQQTAQSRLNVCLKHMHTPTHIYIHIYIHIHRLLLTFVFSSHFVPLLGDALQLVESTAVASVLSYICLLVCLYVSQLVI